METKTIRGVSSSNGITEELKGKFSKTSQIGTKGKEANAACNDCPKKYLGNTTRRVSGEELRRN